MRGVVKARTMSLYDSVSSEGSAPAAPAAPPAAAASSDDDKKKAAGAIACVLAVLGYWYFTHNPSTSTEGMPSPPSSAVAPSAGFVSDHNTALAATWLCSFTPLQMSFRGVRQHQTHGAFTCVTPSSTIPPPTQSSFLAPRSEPKRRSGRHLPPLLVLQQRL